MMCNKKTDNACCCIYSIIASLIAATGIAAIFFSGAIAAINILIYISLAIGALILLYILFSTFCSKKCPRKLINDSCLISSAVGAIVTSIFALTATSLATLSVGVAILIGSVAFFLFSNLINVVNFIFKNACNYNECE